MSDYTPELNKWFASVDGKYVDVDKKHGPQCVDGSKHWAITEFKVPSQAYGNGRDVAVNLTKQPGWTFVGPDKPALPGDVVSWDKGWGGLWEDGELVYYGHTAVVVRDLGTRLEVIQQNPRPMHKATVGKNGLVGYARPPRKPANASAKASASTHTVKSGETLYGISRKYGLTVEALRSANPGINAEELLVGHTLKIPTAGRTHVVKAGDTLYGIARTNGTTVSALKALNPKVNADDLRIGSSIVIR